MNDTYNPGRTDPRTHARRNPAAVSRIPENGRGRAGGVNPSRPSRPPQDPNAVQRTRQNPNAGFSEAPRQTPPRQDRPLQSERTGRQIPMRDPGAVYSPAERIRRTQERQERAERQPRPSRSAIPAPSSEDRRMVRRDASEEKRLTREERKQRRLESYRSRNLVRWTEQEKRENAWQRDIVRVKVGFDRPLFALIVILLALGSIMVLSASYPMAVRKGYGALYYAKRQGLFVLLGVIAMIIGWKIPLDKPLIRRGMPVAVWLTAAALLVVVTFIGVSEGEAQRWIQIPGVPVTVQPSEIMKIGEVLLLAMYADVMRQRMENASSLGSRYVYNVVLPGLLVGMSCALIIVGKHLSGTMIVGVIGLFMVLTMVDRKCRWWWAPLTIAVLLAAAAAVYIIAIPYARTRFMGIFSPDSDRWQSMQSLYAVGSGGLFGVGVGQSRQKYSYLGAAHTDFIFAIWCEEFGFVGAIVLIGLFFAFLWRGYRIASRAKDPFSMLVAYGITTHFAVQIIGHMVVDTTYMNTGISLPFFSYGGSSLIMQLFEAGLLLNISRHDYRSRSELEEAELRKAAGLD